ncbi:hypothetical protein SETIT_1G113900v2 [Setaria italica]|uniref:Uncharacterized protein n=2 Tax=Setaria TaxID=4554 RepID=A0A368PJ70_SETIT|nr:hypothetical protein SETIT_1G113900v2 [Setaria italica]TKW38424.1 hypothetical protein SEVIR_1G113420v2 [Setaria viridis]
MTRPHLPKTVASIGLAPACGCVVVCYLPPRRCWIAQPWPPRRPRLSAPGTSACRACPSPFPLRPDCRPPPRGSGPAAWPSPHALRRGRGPAWGTWRRSGPGCPCTSRAPTTCSSPTPRAPSPAPSTTARPASRSSSQLAALRFAASLSPCPHYLLIIARFLAGSRLVRGWLCF